MRKCFVWHILLSSYLCFMYFIYKSFVFLDYDKTINYFLGSESNRYYTFWSFFVIQFLSAFAVAVLKFSKTMGKEFDDAIKNNKDL